jgi:transcriptional regulator with XRE-family HTH domain
MRSSPVIPIAVERELERIGSGIETARLRRNMSQQELADRVGVSFHTIRSVESGRPGTAMGTYVHALWILGLMDTLASVADPALDSEGLVLEASDRRRSGGRRGGSMSNDF